MSEAGVDSRRLRARAWGWHPAGYVLLSVMAVLGLFLFRGVWMGNPQGAKFVGLVLCIGFIMCGCQAFLLGKYLDHVVDAVVEGLPSRSLRDRMQFFFRSGGWVYTVGIWLSIAAAYFMKPAESDMLVFLLTGLAALYVPCALVCWSSRAVYQRLLLRLESVSS